jgi:hypothetical protein
MAFGDGEFDHLALKRETVQRVRCPRCGAGPGEPCKRVNGAPRISNHRHRISKAQAFIGSKLVRSDSGNDLETADGQKPPSLDRH